MKAEHKTLKNILQAVFFLALMALTFYAIFRRNDLSEILSAVKTLDPFSFLCAAAAAVFFVCAEGFMIWYLLRLTRADVRLFRCLGYSFIGFFFSGITPSASGGQPAQLIFMKKDGIPLGDSALTLMTVAVLYKLILVCIGLGTLLFWKDGLEGYLGGYMALFYLGIALNSLLVILLLLLMLHGSWIEMLLLHAEGLCIRLHILKPSETRKKAFHHLISDYQDTLSFFRSHKIKILFVALCTFFQRCSLFVLTYFIYRGFGLAGQSVLLVMVLQASVYVAVDMLPLPGSQGISELMYHAVFAHIFSGGYLAASMCLTRGLSFYFLLILGVIITLIRSRRCIRG